MKAYYKVIVLDPEMSEAEVMHTFKLLDTAKDGKRKCEEFTAACSLILFGVEETKFQRSHLDHSWIKFC